MAEVSGPYRGIAAFYEAEHAGLEADIAFFDRRALGGAVLVGGCGTGRVSRGLSTNHRAAGLDLSSEMLDEARRLDPTGEYVQGDLRTFDLGRRFTEVILPNGTFNFLATRADQLACLKRCHAALPKDGVLTLDMPMPIFRLWGSPQEPPREAWAGQVGRDEVVRTREVRRSIARQLLELTDRYYIDGDLVATVELRLRLVMPAEAEWMMEAAGFWVDEVCGDHAGRAIRDASERVIVRAVAG